MSKKRKSDKLRGASRMREQGCKMVQLWLAPEDWTLIRAAAKRRERWKPIATWIREVAIEAARRLG